MPVAIETRRRVGGKPEVCVVEISVYLLKCFRQTGHFSDNVVELLDLPRNSSTCFQNKFSAN